MKAPSLFKTKTALDVEEELQFHIELLERKYAQQGMSAAAAKTAASRRFGNLETVKRQCVIIRKRSSPLRSAFKMSLILVALAGLAIRLLSLDYKIGRIGSVLVMIALAGRLLLYVRGLTPRNSEKPECS